MVGVCGCDDLKLCNPARNVNKVLFCNLAYNYERGKYHQEGTTEQGLPKVVFEPETVTYGAAPHLASHLGQLKAVPEWHREPVVFATGSAVRSDQPAILDAARKHVHRRASGVDMEASAFLEACQSYDSTICLGVVKTAMDGMKPYKAQQDDFYKAFV
ncbi:hypothetical protein WJX72_009808, partial [[Myrmecia] bisecta]